MRKKAFTFSILLAFVSLSQIIFAQNFQKGLFWEGSTSFFLLNGKGKIDENNFNITSSFTFSEAKELGWGWENKLLYGFKPILGYRILPNIAIFCAYNFYLTKGSDRLVKNYDQSPIDSLGISTPRFKMDYSQNTIQFFCQYYPFSSKGLFFLAGIEYVNLKTKYEITYSDHGPSAGMCAEYNKNGNDNTCGVILGGGIEINLPFKNISLLASSYYSFANYKGNRLFIFERVEREEPSSPFLPTKINVNSVSNVELGVGGFSATLGFRMYLQDVVEKTKKDSLRTLIIVGTGFSKALGEGSEYLRIGYNIGFNIYSNLSSNISFGGRLAYNRIPPNGEELIKLGSSVNTYDYNLESTSGALSIIEIIPSMMISPTNNKDSKTTLNIIGGLGVYSLISNYKVKGSYERENVQSTIEIERQNESETKFGFQLGLLLSIQKRIIIQPLYNMIFTEKESTKYFSINIGYNLITIV